MIGFPQAFSCFLMPPYASVAGLRVMVSPGEIWLAGSTFLQVGGYVNVQASSTSYIYINTTNGQLAVNVGTGFPSSNAFPVSIVVTNATEIVTLTDARPDVFGGGSGGGGGSGDFSINEIPNGLINGSNTVFTLQNIPTSLTTALYWNGLRMTLGVDYTVGASNSFTTSQPPQPGDVLVIDYQFS